MKIHDPGSVFHGDFYSDQGKTMSIYINYKNGEYHWELYDGPDGVDHFAGICSSIGECFEQIMREQIRNSMRY